MTEREIFLAAMREADPAGRAAFLQEVCGSDQEMRASVESLLNEHVELGDFLEAPAANGSLTASSREGPGTVIGSYKLLEQIGEGGFGIVFMADQLRPVRRKVALKILKPGMDARQVVARFEAERQALAMMDHPNIAHVLDGGETESGRPYFVMELVRGVPITDYCDDNNLPVRERLELFISVCRAVQHAHQKGVIHRDLKPSNILVTLHDDTAVAKVIDFGIAKAMGQQLTEKTLFTCFVQMVGTPLYMSPEQAQMSGLDVDTRSDIYSLGVLLYELLTGTTPFDKERIRTAAYDEIRRIIREEEPARPSKRINTLGATSTEVTAKRKSDPIQLSQQCRGELDWIVMKALEKNRNRRYETASALAADVERYLRDEPVLACPPSTSYKIRKFVRRYRGSVMAATIVMFALVGGVVAATWGLIRATEARTEARQSERAKSEQLWEALVAQARANRLTRRSGQRFETLDILGRATDLARTLNLPAKKLLELRNAAIAAMALPDLYLSGPWVPYPTDQYNVDFDESHTNYARTDRRGNCSVRRVADDFELYHLPGLGGRASPRFDRGGRFLAVVHHGKEPAMTGVAIDVWDLESGNAGPKAHKVLTENHARQADFHRDGRQIVLAYNDGTIRRFELPSGASLGQPLEAKTLTREVVIALHPTEPLVAVCSYFGRVVQIRDVNTNDVVASLPQARGTHHAIWHPDGQTLAISTEGEPIKLVDRTTLQAYRTLPVSGTGTHLIFNNAGDRLISSSWQQTVELFDVDKGQKLFESSDGCSFRFSRDDRRLAGGVRDGKIGFWCIGDGREYRRSVRQVAREGPNTSVAVHPNHRLLAASRENGFGLWDLDTGRELAFVPMEGGNFCVTDLRFEPSGALLTSGVSGLYRWPVRFDAQSPDRLTIGPRERLRPRASFIDRSADGRVIVGCCRAVGQLQQFGGGWVLHADRPDDPIRLDAGADIEYITVSPDGRWVVTVNQSVGLAKVWDASDGHLVRQLGEWGAGYPRFNPDSLWLATQLEGGRLFSVPAWEPGPRILVHSFAPNGTMAAVNISQGLIRLIDTATGDELATLEAPDLDGRIGAPVFSPDSTTLISPVHGGFRVWNLRQIRQKLTEMGLDWDALPYPSEKPDRTTTSRMRVDVLQSN